MFQGLCPHSNWGNICIGCPMGITETSKKKKKNSWQLSTRIALFFEAFNKEAFRDCSLETGQGVILWLATGEAGTWPSCKEKKENLL